MASREMVLYKIFLKLQRAYDALDRDRCIKMLDGCDVGPREICILRKYWGRHTMVVKARVYYASPPSRATTV